MNCWDLTMNELERYRGSICKINDTIIIYYVKGVFNCFIKCVYVIL